MRKTLVFAVLALFATMSMGYAQKFGLFSGYPLGFGGLYYLSEDMRIVGSVEFLPGGFGVAGGVEFILGKAPVSEEDTALNYYYGAGANAGFATMTTLLGDFSAFGVTGYGLGGLEYLFSESMGGFIELDAGPSLVMYSLGGTSGTKFDFSYGAKVGLNFY